MKKILTLSAFALGMSAFAIAPAAAHPEKDIKAAGKCDPITPGQWNKIRAGMTLSEVEHITGCHGLHHQTVEFKAGPLESYHFKKGSKILARITFRADKMKNKYGYYSGL